jgi:hypothetical protein
VTSDDVQRARDAGATDREIHDTVLISAAFSMFNRYVDGLATFTPVTTPRMTRWDSGWRGRDIWGITNSES